MKGDSAATWPAHAVETLPWAQQMRGGTREDRMLRSVDATVPPLIANRDFAPSVALGAATERALVAVAQADTDARGHSAALSRFMMRTESVASSKIERINASATDFARAIAGNRSNTSATSMVAASVALHGLVTRVGEEGRFRIEDILGAHHVLMADDPVEAAYAGRFRDMQNWIGGSDHSPRGALHVPPAPERVAGLMNDLIDYLNRDDVPILVQAAIAHAQFESIHAFTDGNGRIGRALISAVLRRRGVSPHAVIPLASGILARREEYFSALDAYRAGDPVAMIGFLSQSARVAAEESRTSIARILELPSEWTEALRPRRGSSAELLISAFYEHPVMSSTEIERRVPLTVAQLYRTIDRMEELGILNEITGRKRDRVWVAVDLLAELDDLDRRIQQAMR